MLESSYDSDVLVIGGGPGGYVAAIRAAQLGLRTVCVEMAATLGGTCVNVGCIPSKALLQSSEQYEFARLAAHEHGIRIESLGLDLAQMLRRKDAVVAQNTRGIEFLFRKHQVRWIRGQAILHPENSVEVVVDGGQSLTLRARNVIIATGSSPVQLPFLPFDEERIVSNVGALQFQSVPRHLAVIGGGVIGLELGSVWRRLGARVTIIELLPTILSGFDEDVVREAERVFRRQGLEICTGSRVTDADLSGTEVRLQLQHGEEVRTLEVDKVLVAVGRRPSLGGIDAARLGLRLGPGGEIAVDTQMRTNLPNVYAIGDVTGGKLLAHKAEEEGIVAAEVIAGQRSRMHYNSIPSVVYTWPEIASVGLTEREARAAGRAVRVGRFPYSANGRARTLGDSLGFVKFVADGTTDELLGCHMIGPNVSELVAEVVLAFEYRASAEDIALTVHAHPTLAEATREAALSVLGRALHL
jgi:dihydrolipoamide dehydrogenase